MMRKTLFERRKGKEMHASGSWRVTATEQKLINAVAVFFTISVIAVLVSAFVQKKWFLIASIICCAVAFVSMFVVLFGLVIRKSRQQPMETHYYDVDYRYNGFNGETDDKTREISKEEFVHGTEDGGEKVTEQQNCRDIRR